MQVREGRQSFGGQRCPKCCAACAERAADFDSRRALTGPSLCTGLSACRACTVSVRMYISIAATSAAEYRPAGSVTAPSWFIEAHQNSTSIDSLRAQ
ncbi:hypothetical protein T492DRAFT_1016793, partial [Pavlovales sp. CCMP2436]